LQEFNSVWLFSNHSKEHKPLSDKQKLLLLLLHTEQNLKFLEALDDMNVPLSDKLHLDQAKQIWHMRYLASEQPHHVFQTGVE
jgi:hypothetical protein